MSVGMSTEEMMALPIGTRVRNTGNGQELEKVADEWETPYRCSFRKVQKRGLSKNIIKLYGTRVQPLPLPPTEAA